MESLDELLAEELKDIYSAEKQLLRALPKMAKKASAPELKTALTEHTEMTQRQIERLEDVFEALGKPAKAKTCKAMQGLLEEAKEIMEEDASDAVLDAGHHRRSAKGRALRDRQLRHRPHLGTPVRPGRSGEPIAGDARRREPD
jgi:ferritin-like metal-binding protein YciE